MKEFYAPELEARGMSIPEAGRKEILFVNARKALERLAPIDGPLGAWFVPGRVEFLGKHTDYAGGRSLVCAIERGICALARPRTDGVVRIVEAAAGSRAEFDIRPDLPVPEGSWATYPATVLRRVCRDFPAVVRGFDIAFASDLPQAAGLSSSSALVVAVYLALVEVNRLRPFPSDEEVAGYLGAVENGRAFGLLPAHLGVGTHGGSQDQTAILCSQPGQLAQFSWDPVRLERWIKLPDGYRLAIAVSGVVAEKTGKARDAYNAASGAASELLRRWRLGTGRDDATLAAAMSSGPGARAHLESLLADSEALRARLEQFVVESFHLILEAGNALERGDLAALGPLVDRSQAAAERGLGNQRAETIHLARSGRQLGAVAASAFGAGFGGSVWALVEEERLEEFLVQWARDYRAAFPELERRSEFFTTGAGPAACRLMGLG
ncbi:MAG: galactokinase [Gemmatimonadales bacterium]|nr:galactokinase [Gemmatimonadales bacterium]